MEDDAPVIYGLEFQARALCAQEAETDSIHFLVGTQSLRAENQVHFIDFDDENNVINKTIYLHREGEIWSMSACTFDSNLFSTCYNKTSDTKSELQSAVWSLPNTCDPPSPAGDDNSSSHPHLNLVCYLKGDEHSDIKSVLWHPTGDNQKVVGLCEDRIMTWDLDTASCSAKMTSCTSIEGKGHPRLMCGRWNPHHNCHQIATANDTSIKGWDLRSMSQTFQIESAHSQLVRDLDFNPNKQYYFASCGDDCRVKFWDSRNVSEPLKVLSEHSHWVWSVRYNHFHDQLVLTSSSDSRVVLNSVVSLSSEPYGRLVEKDDLDDDDEDDEDNNDRIEDNYNEGNQEPAQDKVIATYEEHEDSVYAVDWSSADPWTFASLSYDGRLVINRVPRSEKYKILL